MSSRLYIQKHLHQQRSFVWLRVVVPAETSGEGRVAEIRAYFLCLRVTTEWLVIF